MQEQSLDVRDADHNQLGRFVIVSQPNGIQRMEGLRWLCGLAASL
jgi:hypothetical protein